VSSAPPFFSNVNNTVLKIVFLFSIKSNLVVHPAMKSGWIDELPEYNIRLQMDLT